VLGIKMFKKEMKSKEEPLVKRIIGLENEEPIEEKVDVYEKESEDKENYSQNTSRKKGIKIFSAFISMGLVIFIPFYFQQNDAPETKEKPSISPSIPKENIQIPSVDNKVFIPLAPIKVVQKQPKELPVIKPRVKKIESKPIFVKKTKVLPKVKKKIVKKVIFTKRIVTIKKGDTLASLAEKYYGNPMQFNRIVRANAKIRSSKSMLHLGQKVSVPFIQSNKKKRFVTIRQGNTLASLAKKFYGNINKVQDIVDANYKIKNKNTTLHLGQKVYIPR